MIGEPIKTGDRVRLLREAYVDRDRLRLTVGKHIPSGTRGVVTYAAAHGTCDVLFDGYKDVTVVPRIILTRITALDLIVEALE